MIHHLPLQFPKQAKMGRFLQLNPKHYSGKLQMERKGHKVRTINKGGSIKESSRRCLFPREIPLYSL